MTTDAEVEGASVALDHTKVLAERHLAAAVKTLPSSASIPVDRLSLTIDEALTICQEPEYGHERVANWILDNDFQLKRAVRQIKKDLPEPFYQELPSYLVDDQTAIPRVLDVAHAILSDAQLQITRSVIVQFVKSYQAHSVLLHGELWALPAMMRLACLTILVQSLAQLESRIDAPEIPSPGTPLPLDDPAECIARSIASLVALNSIDWKSFVDELSALEAALSADPANAYQAMTFSTRERYRKAVETVAKRSNQSELNVAKSAIRQASAAKTTTRQHHVGYWLVDDGIDVLEREMGMPVRRVPLSRLLHRHARSTYAVLLMLTTFLALWLPLWYLARSDASVFQLSLLSLLMIIPASVLGITIVHWLVPKLTRPGTLPALDFSKAIPEHYRCAVAVPVILNDVADAKIALQKLELQWLSNPDPALSYVLLSDLADANEEFLAADVDIETTLHEGIVRLNQSHRRESGPFHLLHRRREFNASEGCWMGWERKRGKLERFNRFLLQGENDSFAVTSGPTEGLPGTRYVITLDADTLLPPGTAAELVGTLSHPLNKATVNPHTGRIDTGYTVLQPRVELIQDVGDHSVFAKLYAGDSAIDIYSRAVSDVYQDLFDTGLYIGKGIYDVASFQNCVEQRMPENHILSHDLIEGIHGRVGLVSNIVVYEQFPDTYPEYAARQHRWIRGDWQLLPWLSHRVPVANGERDVNPLSLLDRWKLVDNMRRSLVPPVLLLLLILGWMALPGSALAWTALGLAILGSYLLNDAWKGISQGVTLRLSTGVVYSLQQQVGRWFLSIVFLVNDSLIAIDAISRTLWRLLVSRHYLLEWRSAAHSRAVLAKIGSRRLHWQSMWPATAFAIVLALVLYRFEPSSLWAATPVLVLWALAPEITYRLGRQREFRRETLNRDDTEMLRELARRTWHFFDTFARPQDHWLPPDNFQESPKGEIAHRTSPTNIGLYLVSTLAARDFGFIGSSELAVRCSNTLDTMDSLEMYQGHLLNWYNTATLEPLEPRYVSTVDNGNLAISLLAVKQGCIELGNKPILDESIGAGLETSFRLLANSVEPAIEDVDSPVVNAIRGIEARITQLKMLDESWHAQFRALVQSDWSALQQFISDLLESDVLNPTALHDMHTWYERFNHQLIALQRDLDRFYPWLSTFYALRKDDQIDFTDWPSTMPFQSLDVLIKSLEQQLESLNPDLKYGDKDESGNSFKSLLQKGLTELRQLQNDLQTSAERADAMAYAMNFDMLYDADAHLFRIGYNVSAGRYDHNTYDLLASEARLASFFAIAKKDVPVEHWAHLGRPISRVGQQPVLLSWSGSMFEYLMPPLFLPGKRDTLLGESEKLAVISQRHYARERDVPWGVSESAFGAFDADDNYQYRAFGTPGLGLRRGLGHDLVIAPYASALALCVMPESAVANMRWLQKLDAQGLYGFIDALDFTDNRRRSNGEHRAVKTYMAHHQGMTLAAVVNALLSDVMVDRVLREKPLQTVELLLQERIPWDAPIELGRERELPELPRPDRAVKGLPSWEPATDSDVPQIQILGNGRLSSWNSASGGGALFLGKIALTRWSSYPTSDAYGQNLFVGLDDSIDIQPLNRVTSPATGINQKAHPLAESPQTVFAQHKVESHRRFGDIIVRQVTTVAPNDDVEVRIVNVINEGSEQRRISLTSYAEVSLAPLIEDERHPTFSKLFVYSQYLPERKGLLFTRRSRDKDKHPPVFLHQVVFDDTDIELLGYATDRKAFLGRPGSADLALGLREGLSGSVGWTQDAVMALQVGVTLHPGAQRQLAFLSIAAADRHAVLDVANRYPSPQLDWVVQDANLEASHEISQLEIEPSRIPELQVLVSTLLHPVSSLRVHHGDPTVSPGSQTMLWQFGLSGDIPILLLTMATEETSGALEHLIRAQHLWRRKGFEFDLVVLRKDSAGYEEPLREQILSVLRDFNVFGYLGRRGGIHLLSADHIEPHVRRTLESMATVVLKDNSLTLAEQLQPLWEPRGQSPLFDPIPGPVYSPIAALARRTDLLFDNGVGGFDPHTGDYVIHVDADTKTPAPWCNVIANEKFGTVVSESGLGFSWLINSGEFRITPWANDPVADLPSEILYLRDEASADCWSVTPAPLAQGHAVSVSHGPGYTRWSQQSHGLEQHLVASVTGDDPVKLLHLQLRNPGSVPRRITATYYVAWCLGAVVSQARPHVRASYDAKLHAVFAHNAWSAEFADCVAFVSATLPPHSISGDRADFLGPARDVKRPQALQRWELGGHFSPSSDPCAAYQIHLDIAPGATEEVVFILGAAESRTAAEQILNHWQSPAECIAGIDTAQSEWQDYLDALQVKTPDLGFDLMVNRWLPYQALSCRVNARAGYYQAGGAFGFRDQLQDVLALVGRNPARVRAQILEAARHQFEQGDALHWWHPPAGRGVRTRCSDDYLWLVYVLARYINATGDSAILDVEVPFLHAPPLRPDEHDRYSLYESGEIASLYTHCCRALQYMQRVGIHGLPLIGDGDWNDGMNRVGDQGRGESVWLAWFQITVIDQFSRISLGRGDSELVNTWRHYAEELKSAVEMHAWDGEWYARAFDDAGIAWGSSTNDECQIDSLSQSWAVLSAAADEDRARTAMDSASAQLLDSDNRLVRLLAPPFDHTERDPGYIKAYPPGVRENGGQYTHAATWFGLAAAALGDGDKALQVFDIISPIRRTLDEKAVNHYAREPYVLPGDVSGSVSDPGRGGWSWYTGAASWTWQLGVHGILGIDYVPGGIVVDPCLPTHWDHVEITLRRGSASIALRIENPDGVCTGDKSFTVNGKPHADDVIEFPSSNTVKRVVLLIKERLADVVTIAGEVNRPI